MPFFKLKSKQGKSKPIEVANGAPSAPVRARWQSTWTSTVVQPDEVEDLIHAVTAEMKLRAEALDSPFFLLPFRPNTDQSSARSFVDAFFKSNASGSQQYSGANLQQELRLTSPAVLCSILKWCWSRIPKGVVSWPVYESFELGEKEANMARNAFDTFIPLGVESPARTNIIIDFFSLLAAVAAHGKLNGLGGRKLSRLAGWWAFEHTDDGKGFEGGYKSWTRAADASSHLFFAYLRSLSPELEPSMNVIERIPRSLQALLAQTEYPPEAPLLLQRTTAQVVMLVDQVSPTPFALLRRAKHFEYHQNDQVLRDFSEFEDPVDALTDECKRVLYAIATTNSARVARSRHGLAKTDETWSSFTSLGFGDLDPAPSSIPRNSSNTLDAGMNSSARSGHGLDRPTTPSWGDFMSSGFHDEAQKPPSTMLLPPDKVLPPLGNRRNQTPSIMSSGTEYDDDVTPGELAAVTSVELDDAFWWVWMTSLAGEEPIERKAVFGRCALIETTISGKWLIMEEQVKGATPDPVPGAVMVEKKSRFSFTKRGRLGRGKSTNSKKQASTQIPVLPEQVSDPKANRMTLGLDQQAKIKAAAVALSQKKDATDATNRRGRQDDPNNTKTNSTFTLGLQSEAGPAMKWANTYDKDNIRAAYLGSNLAGTGQSVSTEDISRQYTNSIYTDEQPATAPSTAAPAPAAPAIDTAAPQPPAKTTPTQLSPVKETQPGQYDSMQKELGIPRQSASNDDHPAYRKQQPTQQAPAVQTPASPARKESTDSPAIRAAKMALEGRSVGPESGKTNNKMKKQAQPSTERTGGLKKLFSRREKGDRRSFDVQQQAASVPTTVSETTEKRDAAPTQQQPPESPVAAHKPASSANPALAAAAAVMPASQGQYNDSVAALSRVDSQEQRDADIAFSRFDQGPMEDMPAAAPSESPELEHEEYRHTEPEDAAVPPGVPRYSPRDTTPAHYVPQPPAAVAEPVHTRIPSADDTQSEATMEDARENLHTTAATVDPSKDRWERIRENAARRAANARASEDTSTMSRPTEGGRTDDGETSGEETIESRVARIKARVAELTGNMDGGAPSSLRR